MTHRRRRHTPSVAFAPQPLEARCMLSGDVVSPAGLPLLHSFPGAPAAVFLDFDGYGATYVPYDTDGDPATFGPSEQADVRLAWRHVASYFSMFDLDVTTEQPASVPYSYSIISDPVGSGYNVGPFPSTAPTNLNPGVDARARQSALAHEIGHSFGLDHQSTYDRRGGRVQEYSDGFDALHGTIMGADYARDVHKWFVGHPASSGGVLQDDVATIARKISSYVHQGDGFHPDDVADDLEAAEPVARGADGIASTSGVIERLADADAYAFTHAGGGVKIDVTTPVPSMLDAKLELYGDGGLLLACADGSANNQHLTMELPSGTYYAVVSSHGGYADLGPYDLTVRPADVPPAVPPRGTLDAPTNLLLSLDDKTGIVLGWDAVEGADGYVVERSDDGAAWRQVGTTGAEVTGYADAGLPGARRYFYRVAALDGAHPSAPSGAASAVNRPSAPAVVTAGLLKPAGIVVDWRDTSGETGYRVERRGGDAQGEGGWTEVAVVGANVPSFTDRLADANAIYSYRVTPLSGSGDSPSAEATTPMPDVTGLRVAARVGGRIDLAWLPTAGAATYTIERSSDNSFFDSVGSSSGAEFSDRTVAPLTRYYYRVVADNGAGESVRSATLTATSTAEGPLPPAWHVYDVGTAYDGAAARFGRDAAGYNGASDTFSMVAAGTGIFRPNGTVADAGSFRIVSRRLTGNTSITARVLPPTDAPDASFAGIMIRDYAFDTANFAFVGVSAQYGTRAAFQNFPDPRGSTPGAGDPHPSGPIWLRLTRRGGVIDSYGSPDGVTWQSWGTFTTLDPTFSFDAEIGLVAWTGNDNQAATFRFDNVYFTNRSPVIISPPTATPARATGATITLSVVADDERGEANLRYTWSLADGPRDARPPTVGANGTNAAKSAVAMLYGPGHYVFRVDVRNGAGFVAAATVAVDVTAGLADVLFTPRGAPVHVGQTVQFTAALRDQFGRPFPLPGAGPPPVLDWTATGGTVDAAGLFKAPDSAGWYTIGAVVEGTYYSTDLYVYDDAAPTLLSAASRKTHGAAGAFDLPLLLFGGPAAVEPRRGGPTALVFTFSRAVAAADGLLGADDFTLNNATFGSARIVGNVLSLDLVGVADGGLVAVALAGIAGADGTPLAGVTDVQVRARYGDVDRDGAVTSLDLVAVRSRLGRRLGPVDLLYDLDLSGAVTAADLILARRGAARRVR